MSPRPLGFEASPLLLPLQRPLALKLASLVGHLVDRVDRNLDMIRRQRLQQGAADQIVDGESPDLLAKALGSLIPVGVAADGDALQQGDAFARRALLAGLVVVLIVLSPLLVTFRVAVRCAVRRRLACAPVELFVFRVRVPAAIERPLWAMPS